MRVFFAWDALTSFFLLHACKNATTQLSVLERERESTLLVLHCHRYQNAPGYKLSAAFLALTNLQGDLLQSFPPLYEPALDNCVSLTVWFPVKSASQTKSFTGIWRAAASLQRCSHSRWVVRGGLLWLARSRAQSSGDLRGDQKVSHCGHFVWLDLIPLSATHMLSFVD